MQDIHIEQVASTKDLTTFIRAPYGLYKDDPNWVKPLEMERMDLLRTDKNPFFKHAEAAYWIAKRGDENGEVIGRISAQIDQLVCEQVDPEMGQFGMFECIDDVDVANRLFETAETWLREHGAKRVRGPYNLSVNEECGLHIDGFDTPPMIMMGHARPYYQNLITACGYKKAKDMFAYKLMIADGFPDKFNRITKIAERNKRLKLRQLDKGRIADELKIVFDIFNDAWSENWGFVPFTDDEALFAAKAMKPILRPDLARICLVDGEPAAFMITLPNINDFITDLDGRLFPFGWAKLLWRIYMAPWTRVRVPLMGVRKEYQNTPLGAAMACLLIEHSRVSAVARGTRLGELSWILEDNQGMRKILEVSGSEIYRTYRVFEKEIEA